MTVSFSRLGRVATLLIAALFSSSVFAQATPAVITNSFNPSVVLLGGASIATITVTNPNAALHVDQRAVQ